MHSLGKQKTRLHSHRNLKSTHFSPLFLLLNWSPRAILPYQHIHNKNSKSFIQNRRTYDFVTQQTGSHDYFFVNPGSIWTKIYEQALEHRPALGCTAPDEHPDAEQPESSSLLVFIPAIWILHYLQHHNTTSVGRVGRALPHNLVFKGMIQGTPQFRSKCGFECPQADEGGAHNFPAP